MKNKKGFLLFGLLTFISCFFCIGDVKAYDKTIIEKSINFSEAYYFVNFSKEIHNTVVLYNNSDNNYYLVVERKMTNNDLDTLQNKGWYINYYKSGSTIDGHFLTSPGWQWLYLYKYNYSTEDFVLDTSGKLGYSYISSYKAYVGVNFDNDLFSIVYTDKNIYYKGDNDLLHNGLVYKNNDLVFGIEDNPKYEFSEIINTNLIDSVEFKFNDIPLNETGIVYNFDFSSVLSDGSYSETQFSQPFGREYYTGCDEETQSCSSSLKSKDYLFYDLDFISRHYELLDVRVFNESPEHITSSYSIILPLEHDIGKYIDIFFHSDYEFEVIFHYKSDEDSTNSYLETIDITNKYGVVFLPWYDNDIYVDRDTFYLTDFQVVGNVDIQVTDSRDPVDYNILQLYSMNYCNHSYQEQTNIPYNCDNLTGVFKFKIDNLTANQTLRFVNHAYSTSQGTKTLITYDTRYFNYTILDTPYSTGEVIDPVTGEKHNINLNDFYNQFNNHSNSGFKSALNRFLSPIKFIFRNISNLFNNYLNQSLQDYFFFAFSLMLIILILRVIF